MNWALTILFVLGSVFSVVLFVYLLVQLVRGFMRRDFVYSLAAIGGEILWICVIVLNAFVYFGAGISHGNKDNWIPILFVTTGPVLFGVGFGIFWMLRKVAARHNGSTTNQGII